MGPRSSNRRPVRSLLSLESWPRQLRALQWFAGSGQENGAFPGGTLWSRRPDFTTRRVPSSVTQQPPRGRHPLLSLILPQTRKALRHLGWEQRAARAMLCVWTRPRVPVLTLLFPHRAEIVCLCPDSSSSSSKPSSDGLRFRTCLRSPRGSEPQVK